MLCIHKNLSISYQINGNKPTTRDSERLGTEAESRDTHGSPPEGKAGLMGELEAAWDGKQRGGKGREGGRENERRWN